MSVWLLLAQCFDDSKNIVLYEAEEYKDPAGRVRRIFETHACAHSPVCLGLCLLSWLPVQKLRLSRWKPRNKGGCKTRWFLASTS